MEIKIKKSSKPLDPCPFCGGNNVYIREIIYGENNEKELYSVQHDCGRFLDVLVTAPCKDINEAISLWNER